MDSTSWLVDEAVPFRTMQVTTRAAGVSDQRVDRTGAGPLLLETVLGRYRLNSDAGEVWSAVNGRRSVKAIVAAIASARSTKRDAVERPVTDTLRQLAELGLIESS